MKKLPVAIVTSDWHLSHKPPIARSAEKDWYAAMRRPIRQVREIQKEFNGIPVIIAGDIVHHWNEPAELINFAIKEMPPYTLAIPGQHDMPQHQIKDMHRSAYHSLVVSGRILDLSGAPREIDRTIIINGFPYGTEIKPIPGGGKAFQNHLKVAIVHRYIWEAQHCFSGAPKNLHVNQLGDAKLGYDTMIFGDNHIGFQAMTHEGKSVVFNCGSLFCRNADQRYYAPRVGILYSDGSVKARLMDISLDQWLSEKKLKKKVAKELDLTDLVKQFKRISHKTWNFILMLEQAMKSDQIDPKVKEVLTQIIEDTND